MKVIIKRNNTGKSTLCVFRFGAYGDALIASGLFKYFKDSYVTVHCNERCYQSWKNHPHIDRYEVLDEKESNMDIEAFSKYVDGLRPNYDRVIDLTGSVENSLVIPMGYMVDGVDYYFKNRGLRDLRCNKNYYDNTFRHAGLDVRGDIGEYYTSKDEDKWAKKFWDKRRGYKIVWTMTGSALHKAYPYAEFVIKAIQSGIPEAQIVLVGEKGCKGMIESGGRIYDKCGEFKIRKSFALIKHADLVVTPETATSILAAIFGRPQVLMLSSSSEENLSKYYKNCEVVYAVVACRPCHKLHPYKDTCPSMEIIEGLKVPVCMGALHPKLVCKAVEKQYLKWRRQNGSTNTTDNHNNSNRSLEAIRES